MSKNEHPITTPRGNTYSQHKSLSEALHHTAEVLENRGIKPTVHEAIKHGFKISKDTKEHQHPYWGEKK